MKKYLSLLILFLINFTYAKSVNISSNDTTSVKQYYYSLSSNDNDELTIENSPIILVTTPEELDAVRDLPDADYVLGADIDMSGYNDFVPIPSQQTSFTGTFNGNGYTISNLSITTTEGSNTGLFSHIDEDAVVQNLNLNNITVDAVGENNGIIAGELSGTINQVSVNGHLVSVLGVSGGAVGDVNASGQIQNTHAAVLVEITKNNDNIDVGGLVGFNEGLIENSSATGNVFAYRDVGGLVGENNGGSISLCFATGDVTSDGSNVGGLVGHNDYSGTAASITKSYATGFVGLTRNTSQYFNSDGTVSDIGGLVGENDDSIIKNCYALGNVYGTDDTGGLVGDFSGGTLESSYALGRVVNTSDDEIGGLVAEDDGSGDPSMCYWIDYYTGDSAINGSEENGPELDQVTQVSASTVNTPLAAYSISDLQGANAESTMGSAGDNFFDFETIWQIAPTDMPGHFPTLQGLPAPTGAPLPPTGFKALGGNAQVQLNWESNVESDIQKYTLYRSSDSINFVRNAENKITDVSHTGSGQSYLDTNVSNNTVYYYQITATDTDGNESRSSHHGVAKPAEYSFSVSIEIVDNETNNVYKVNHGDHATDVKGSYASGQEGFIYNYRYEHLEGFLGNAVYHPSDLPNTNVTITPSGLQDNQSWYFYYDDDTVSGDPIRNTTGGAGTGTTLVTGQGNGAVVLEGVSVDFDVTYFLFYADPLPENNSTPALENLSLITISEEPVVLDQDITIIDADLSALNDGQGNYTATSLVLKRNGDANTSDNFSIIDPDAENTDYSIADGNVSFGGKVVANYDNNNGVFTLNFEGLEVIPTQTIINTITQNINFQTTNYDGLDFISWTFSDGEKETSALQQISPIWTGAVNNNWHTAGNWSKDNVPSPTENVFLPGTSNNMPIATQDVNVKYIEIASSASLALSPSAVFKVSGDLLNNGQIIFKSDATGDSHFDEFTGSITGTGTVITEKYYQNKRAFRLVSSPVDGGSLFDNWQNSGANDAGLGTHITGEVGTVGEYNATTGIDYTASGNPSLFGFSTANGWEAITDTKNTNLEAGVPYRL
ncbi:The GLUG motif-containing protein, partial [Psychroflexus salarius]